MTEEKKTPFALPKILAWEVTRTCPLKCKHCRAGAANVAFQNELTKEECVKVIDSLPPMMIIWTGGEPMSRPDMVELVSHATKRGIRSVMAPCGLLVTRERLLELKEAGVMACSFSLDGPDKETHDAFRGVDGAYDQIVEAMKTAREVGMPFQINTTVSKLNKDRLDEIYAKALELGASKLDLFFLVPVGRGKGISQYALDDNETKAVLDWAFDKAEEGKIGIKETCCPSAPAYCASTRPSSGHRPSGCLGGRGFSFLSHTGFLQTCGFIDIPCGNIRDFGFDFKAMVAAASNPLGECGTCRGKI
jgi:MoaA/NifB/PqqE/SkfB family radical SAM enzyme